MKTFLALAFAAALSLVPSAASAQEESLHDFGVTFTDQDGRKTTLAELRGKPVLVTMFYGNCKFACPMLVSRMKRLEAKMSPAMREQMRMVLVTFDPKRDTVPQLKVLADKFAPDSKGRWSFLRSADEDAVQELAAVLGVKYRFMPDGTINHSSVITLLDERGVVRGRMDGMDSPDETILDPLVAMEGAGK